MRKIYQITNSFSGIKNKAILPNDDFKVYMKNVKIFLIAK